MRRHGRRRLILAAIAGPVIPSFGGDGFDVQVDLDDQGYPAVAPSCVPETDPYQPDPPDPWSGAAPAVRLHAVVSGLSSPQELTGWAYSSVCSVSYGTPLQGLGSQVVQMMQRHCLPGPVAGCVDPGVEHGAPRLDQHCEVNQRCLPECQVSDILAYGLPQQERLEVPPCLEVAPDGSRLPGNTDPLLAYADGHPEDRDPALPVAACWRIGYQWDCDAANGAELRLSRPQDPPPKTVAEVTCRVLPRHEQHCLDGRDEDENCLTDLADPCCQDPAACSP